MKTTSIFVFGDSVSYGAFDTDSAEGERRWIIAGWVNRLRTNLENHEEGNFNVFNLGVPGETTEGTLKRFESECSARMYDKNMRTIVVFAIGLNDTQDVNGQYRVTLKQFEKNIKALISKARNFTDTVLFVGLTRVNGSKQIPLFWNREKQFFNEKIVAFDNLLEETCNNEKVSYVKVFDLLSPTDLLDGLHPNKTGHQKMYEAILEKIKEII